MPHSKTSALLQKKISALTQEVANLEKEKESLLFRLASFSEFNPRPITEINAKGQVVYVNPSCKAEFPDLISKGVTHPYLVDFPNIAKKLYGGKNVVIREIKIKERWFRQNFYHIPHLNIIRVFGLDVSDTKSLENNIRINEKRYHDLFEKMNYGYALQDIIFDKQGKPKDYRFVDVNPAFEKLAKLKKETIIGKTANQIAQNPKDPETIKSRKKYDKVAISGKPAYFESHNKEIKKYFELYAYKPNSHQIALILSDITNRKKTDEEKNNFIAVMSHELRNPLTPIMANAQFIKMLLQKSNDADPVLLESITIIEKEAMIMANLLNDILDVSRLSQHKIQLRKTTINICEVIKNSIKTSMPFITTKSQKVSVFFEKEPIHIQADPMRVEQIIVNIINNASKYTPPEGAIDVYCGLEDEYVEIKIKDNGIGMDKNKISRVFELFGDGSQPFLGIGGLGIGLNIVKNLVSMHGGKILVQSKGKNKGSEFTIKLPLHTSQTTNVEPAVPKKESLHTDKKTASRVLIVDDNKDIRNAISKILENLGHYVKTSHTGIEAVEISKTFKPHTALVDIGLPDISGYQVAKLLKQQHTHDDQKIKLIAFTGYGQKSDKKLSKEAGFDYHITKPVDINHLVKLIT